jgi:translocation and assembly module TamA
MVEDALTAAARAFAAGLRRLAMRRLPIVPAALCAAIGMAADARMSWADSPVVIEGADEDMSEAILDLLPDREAPEGLFDAERIAEEAAARATAWLRSEGYYAAEVTPETNEHPPGARLVIAPGSRFTFAAPRLVFDGETPPPAAVHAAESALAAVSEDAPARAAVVLQAEADALSALQQAGYADAALGERRVVVDHATARVAAEFRFSAGELARLGGVRAEPADLLRPGFVADLRNWEPGDPYSPRAVARLRRDATSTGAISLATTRLAPPGPDGLRDIVLEVEPARRNAYELGAGYSTTEGLGVEAQWTRRNLSGRADALTVASTLGELRQEVSIELARPHAAGLGHATRFGASAEREAPEAYTRQGLAIYASVDASRRVRLAQTYGARLSADAYDDLAGGVTEALVLSGFAGLRNDTTEFSLDPRDGSIVEFRVEPSVSTGDVTVGFVRATAEARVYESLGDDNRLTLAARARAGWLEPVAGSADDVPADRRFYAGGGGSVRGYAYNSIYPSERDTLGLAPGGQGLLEGSIEARWRFGERWGAALFADGGTAFDDWRDAGNLRWGVGVGARYDLGFAPLRIDVAFPLDRDEADEDFALYVSLGQAF